MSLSSPIEIVAAIWGVVTLAYFALFLYRSVVGMKEEDTLYLSVGEERLAAEQRAMTFLASRETCVTRGSTYDNKLNLARNFYEKIIGKYEGTRLGLLALERLRNRACAHPARNMRLAK